jgi:membrane protease subunit HflK
MRTDHHAFQRATRIAGFGFMLQLAIGLTLLLFGALADDSPMGLASYYVFIGLLVWLSLIVIFNQHKLERLEALEEDQLAAARTASESVFSAAQETRVAASRLRLMHQWLMPTASLIVAGLLVIAALYVLRTLARAQELVEGGPHLAFTDHEGWALSICLGLAAVSFIFSRFVAGMARLPAWQNLRGGAGVMVGNAVVLLALAVGIGFRFFGNSAVIDVMTHALPWFMVLLAAETVLNFILNVYRPRVPGETPRPAFDSRILSLLSAPDSIVRTLNEAVNYQFGFDITSSWGYQLLLRSVGRLAAFGLIVLVFLNCMVIVEPHQRAVRLAGGEIVGNRVHGPGLMWKMPWPLETAEVHDVTRLQELALTPKLLRRSDASLWTDEIRTDGELRPFIVGASIITPLVAPAEEAAAPPAAAPGEDRFDPATDRLSARFALVDALLTMHYRLKDDDNALLDFLRFASDLRVRRQAASVREEAIKALALREVTRQLSVMSLEEVLGPRQAELGPTLRQRIQQALDERQSGIEVAAVTVGLIRPHGDVAQQFEDLDIARQGRLERVAQAESVVLQSMAGIVGDSRRVEAVSRAIDRWRDQRDADPESEATAAAARELDRLLLAAGGEVAFTLSEGTKDRLVTYMNARAKLTRMQSQQESYRAAPRLFRQREMMKVFVAAIAPMRKYVTGIDPARIQIDTQFKELDPAQTPQIQIREDQRGPRP